MDVTEKRLIRWWGVLAAVTLLSWETGLSSNSYAALTATAAVIGLAFIKVLIVMMQFMEVRIAPWQLKAALCIWAAVCAIAILVLWFRAVSL